MQRAVILGGAGFIGSALAFRLAGAVDELVVYDNLLEQVHGRNPPQLPAGTGFVRADVRDPLALRALLASTDPDVVFHLAAETGTGQSYDVPSRHCDVNVLGLCHLVEALRELPDRPRRIVLASSRAVYGEGAYLAQDGRSVVAEPRRVEDLKAGRFDVLDEGGRKLHPRATAETFQPRPASVYASTKLMQELILRQTTLGTRLQPVVLRFQNVYGPGQSLRNPYTGVLSILADQILRGEMLNIYEDGLIIRDFVYVDDVVDALLVAGASAESGPEPINIGSGVATPIIGAADALMAELGASPNRKQISGAFRVGDVRHAVADIARARERLGWSPKTPLDVGIARLAAWAKSTHEATSLSA